jgi:WD40 repeat protein
MLILEGKPAANRVAFTPDGTRLLVAWGGKCIDVWELPVGERVRTLGPFEDMDTSFAIHPSGRFAFVAAARALVVVPLAGDRSEADQFVNDATHRVIASPDGDWAVGSDTTGGSLIGYQWTAGAKLRLAWAASAFDRREILCGFVDGGERFVAVSSGRVIVRETATGGVLSTCPYPSGYVICSAVSPDGTRFASMGWETLYIWDTAKWGKPTRVKGNSSRQFVSLAFHPTRPVLASVQGGQTLVKFLHAETGKPAAKFTWKLGPMRCVAFSADGTLAAAGSASGKVVVWDVDE